MFLNIFSCLFDMGLAYFVNLKEQFLRIGPYFYDTTLALRAEAWARTGGTNYSVNDHLQVDGCGPSQK